MQCKNGLHEMTVENTRTYFYTESNGKQRIRHVCVECKQEYERSRYGRVNGEKKGFIMESQGIAVLPALRAVMELEPWMEQKACRNVPVNVFFPPRGGDTKTPKAICAECTVKSECLNYAVRTKQDDGIWGGLSATARRGLRAR